MSDWSLAKTAYESTNASRKQLLDKMTLPDPVRQKILARIDATHESRTMETVMREGMKTFRQGDASMMSAWEHSWLSKWNHGDAVALQEIAARLAVFGEDLWGAMNAIPEGTADAQTATLYMLRVLYGLSVLFGGKDEVIDALAKRHAELAKEFHQDVPPELRTAQPDGANG